MFKAQDFLSVLESKLSKLFLILSLCNIFFNKSFCKVKVQGFFQLTA